MNINKDEVPPPPSSEQTEAFKDIVRRVIETDVPRDSGVVAQQLGESFGLAIEETEQEGEYDFRIYSFDYRLVAGAFTRHVSSMTVEDYEAREQAKDRKSPGPLNRVEVEMEEIDPLSEDGQLVIAAHMGADVLHKEVKVADVDSQELENAMNRARAILAEFEA